MAWKPEKNLPHRSPFKKPTYGPGEGEWTFLGDERLPAAAPRYPQPQQQAPPPPPQRSCSSNGCLDIPLSRLSFKSPPPASSSSLGSGVGRAYSVDADSSFTRHYRQSLEQAEQQTAYWQARAKEAEQSILQYKTECVSLQCQLNTLQCSYRSLDGMVGNFVERLQRVGGLLKDLSNEGSSSSSADEEESKAGTTADPRKKRLANVEGVLSRIEDGLAAGGPLVGPDRNAVIAFRSFRLGDNALFFPTPMGDFIAFNVGCPHHYLSKEARAMIGSDRHFRKYYVLGRITRITRCQVPGGATQESHGEEVTGEAVQGLAAGTIYWVVHVEPIPEHVNNAGSSEPGDSGMGRSPASSTSSSAATAVVPGGVKKYE